MPHPSTLTIDLDAIARNHAVLRRVLGQSVGLCAVLKADAYGLGAQRLARKLAGLGLNMIAVYHPHEARDLLKANTGVPILILSPAAPIRRDDPLFIALSRGRVHLTVHDHDSLTNAASTADTLGTTVPVHIEIDTGIGRAGVRLDHAREIIERALAHPRLALAGLSTHFTTADRSAVLTREQADAFRAALPETLPPRCVLHAANSFAAFRDTGLHLNMARVGLALFGYAGEEFADPSEVEFFDAARDLEPACSWTSTLAQVKRLAPGESVGYGATWRAPDKSEQRGALVGTVPVGYADGLPLALSSDHDTGAPRARLRLLSPEGDPVEAPIVGRVSMDQTVIDLTEAERRLIAAPRAGDAVEIIAADRTAPNHLPRLARAAGTITHELLCRLSPAIERRYTASAPAVEPAPAPRRHGAVTGV